MDIVEAGPFVELSEFFQSLSQYRHVWQIPVLVGALCLAAIVALIFQHKMRQDSSDEGKIRRLKGILFLVTLVFAINVLRHFVGVGKPAPLLHMILALTFALAITRLGVYVLHYGVGGSKRLLFLQTLFLRFVWLVFALHITGLLHPFKDWLANVDFNLGGGRVSLWQLMQGSVLVTLVVVGALWLGAWFERKLNRAESFDTHVRVVVVKLVRGLLLFFSMLLAMPLVGIDATFLSVLGGALGVGLGFALQKVASNYVSGFILLMDRSIRMSDVIAVEGRQGTVIGLNARCVTLSATDGTAFIVPNETFLTQTIINYSRMGAGVCHSLTVELVHQTNVEVVCSIMERAAQRQSRILTDPAPQALVGKLTGHGIEMTLYYWIADPGKGDSGLKSLLMQDIIEGLRASTLCVPLTDSVQPIVP